MWNDEAIYGPPLSNMDIELFCETSVVAASSSGADSGYHVALYTMRVKFAKPQTRMNGAFLRSPQFALLQQKLTQDLINAQLVPEVDFLSYALCAIDTEHWSVSNPRGAYYRTENHRTRQPTFRFAAFAHSRRAAEVFVRVAHRLIHGDGNYFVALADVVIIAASAVAPSFHHDARYYYRNEHFRALNADANATHPACRYYDLLVKRRSLVPVLAEAERQKCNGLILDHMHEPLTKRFVRLRILLPLAATDGETMRNSRLLHQSALYWKDVSV